MFDTMKPLSELIEIYSVFFVPLIVIHFMFLLSYIARRMNRG